MARSKPHDWLDVITDAQAIADARSLALASTDSRVRQLMEKPERFQYADIDPVVKANASELLPAWRSLTASPAGPFERRLVAAKFLCDRRDAGGLPFLIATVRTGKKEVRRQALNELYSAVCDDPSWMRRRAPDLPVELLKLFDSANDDMIPMVARMCKDLEVSGAQEKAIALWENPISAWARHALLTDLLPREAKTGQRLDPINAELSRTDLSEFQLSQGLQCATAFLDSPDPNVIRKDLMDNGSGASSEWYPIIEEIGKRGGRAAVPLLERFLRSKLNLGYRGYALNALSNALGPDVLPYVDESAGELRLAPAVADALGRAFHGTGDPNALGRLQKLASRTRDDFARQQITAALKAIGGPGARKAARKQLASSLPHDRQNLKALAERTSMTQACSRLAAIGLISPLSPEEIQAMQATEKREDDDPAWSLLVLDYAHIRTCFDTESSDVPPRHDELIREFAENSRGIFAPEAVLQREGKGRRVVVVVQFVFRGQLYRFQVRDLSDYYDLERMVGTINKALADAGLRERFLSRDTGDQIADFIFGDPRLITEAAQEFQWTLDDDFNSVIV
jgi:hypothetical protein